jgi:hypothetical protein
VSKVQSGLGRPEQRWRAPARNKIALWSVLPGAAIVILVGGLFWASVWIAFRSPTTTVVGAASETASVAASEPGPGPSDGEPADLIAAAPRDDDSPIVRVGPDDADDQDVSDDAAATSRPADDDAAWVAAQQSTIAATDRDASDDATAATDQAASDDQAVADGQMASDDRLATDGTTASDDRLAGDSPTTPDDQVASNDRAMSDGQAPSDEQATVAASDGADGQAVAAVPGDDAEADVDPAEAEAIAAAIALADTGTQFGPELGVDQISAILAWDGSSDDAGDQVADGSTQAVNRAEEIAARAGELTTRAEELTARIDGLTAKIDELQAKLEENGAALTAQPSPSPVPQTGQTVAARPGQQGAQQKPTVSFAALAAAPTPVPGKAPWVVMPQPEPGSKVAAGPIVVETRARGISPITQIRLQIDGLTLQVALDRRDDTTWRGRASTRVAPGTHTVAAAVVDSQGRIGSYQWKFDATP